MRLKRIIPCLDLKDGKVVKGINFKDIKVMGDPVERALIYESQGAGELVFLNIAATAEGKKTLSDAVRSTTARLSIPLTAGGGIKSLEDIEEMLLSGAAKVSVNSEALKNPNLIKQAVDKFGGGKIVVAIDGARNTQGGFNVFTDGGKTDTKLDVTEWAKDMAKKGVGEILLTSIDADGTREGFDLPMLKAVCDAVNIPVIASGGCGTVEHIVKLFKKTEADGAIAASIFHYGDLSVGKIKEVLAHQGIPV